MRDGKAHIIQERCIDCGECIRTCANHAKAALTDGLERLAEFQYRIALPAPSFFGLWRPGGESSRAAAQLLRLGFDAVFEVGVAADIVAEATRSLIRAERITRPAISSACPAVIRLMQVRFPTLLPNLIPLEAPMEIAATLARKEAVAKSGLPSEKIGVFFITPCPAKVTAIKQPVGREKSDLDGAISISATYGAIAKLPPQDKAVALPLKATRLGLEWGRARGEARSINVRGSVAVDGIHNVIGVLDEVERGRLTDVTYVEAQACVGGCLGGCLVSQNPFISAVRLGEAARAYGAGAPALSSEAVSKLYESGMLRFDRPIEARPVMKLDADLGRALAMMRDLETTVESLPGLDCGACGCPNCRALAEDIVRGNALKTDCIFLLRERVRELAEEMVDLARKVPPAMGHQNDKRPGSSTGGGHGDSR